MKRAKWNKSLMFTISLLLYVNNAVHANGNKLKGKDGVDIPNQQDITNDYNIFECISNEGQSASCNDDSPISQSDTQQAEAGSDAKEGNTFFDEKNIVKNVETYFIREGQDKVNQTDLDMEKEGKAMGHVQKNANLRSTSYFSSQGAVNQACNFVQEDTPPLDKNGANIEQVARAQDDAGETKNGGRNGDNKERPSEGVDGKGSTPDGNTGDTISGTTNNTTSESSKEKQETVDEKKEKDDKDNTEGGKTNEKAKQEDDKNKQEQQNKHSESTTTSSDGDARDGAEEAKGGEQNGISPTEEQLEGGAPISDHAEKMRKTLLKEGRELKETTSMIDNAVYNVEQIILKTKFYTTAIRNFVHFKVNHICEYSKCGSNARCYIVEKDKEECRCLANYMPDESVDYFKCIPKTEKDCSKDNGNCDVNAECSIDNKKNIKCQCKHNYIGDGIFCVIGSKEKQSLCLLLVLLICLLHKFLF